jgi:hypothetical protein
MAGELRSVLAVRGLVSARRSSVGSKILADEDNLADTVGERTQGARVFAVPESDLNLINPHRTTVESLIACGCPASAYPLAG